MKIIFCREKRKCFSVPIANNKCVNFDRMAESELKINASRVIFVKFWP